MKPLVLILCAVPVFSADYAIVVSEATRGAWPDVVDALVAKYPDAKTHVWNKEPEEALPALREQHPRHTCFVARPDEAGRGFVARVHRLTRRYDDDPYTDTLWGILTGFDQPNALAIAREAKPLTVRKVASGTEVALDACAEGVWYCELTKNKVVRKEAGGAPLEAEGPGDTTRALAETLTDYGADLFVTSGHATERDWQIGYRYRNGSFRSKAGKLFGQPLAGERFEIVSTNPKVYLPIGNCLMGHVDGPDAMALAWMNSAGVRQMLGYTVPTWFGYQGWGVLDYYVEQPGRYSYTEAFFANHHALVHKLRTEYPELADAAPPPGKVMGRHGEGSGLLFDRDTVAFYGDPAWEARMAEGPRRWDQHLSEQDGTWTFVVEPKAGPETFQPVNKNGAQRGGRPIVQFLPRRVGPVEIVAGAELKPLVADDFILVPLPKDKRPKDRYEVVFAESR